MSHDLQRTLKGRHSGFTIIELVISVTIIGLLISILLPAIQQVRAVARSTQCKNNLHQIGSATHQFADTSSTFPASSTCFVDMLPYLEEASLYAILSGEVVPPVGFTLPRLSWIQCPADSLVDSNFPSPSYVVNQGTVLLGTNFRKLNGFMVEGDDVGIRPSDISDGLSQTAAFSEHLFAPGVSAGTEQHSDEARYFRHTSSKFRSGEEKSFVEECQTSGLISSRTFGLGAVSPAYGYSHLLNPKKIGCFNGPDSFQLELSETVRTSSSEHVGGVNLLFADGSVHFISSLIAENTWIALGTRNGSEPVGKF